MLKARAFLFIGFVVIMCLFGLSLAQQIQNLGESMKTHMHHVP